MYRGVKTPYSGGACWKLITKHDKLTSCSVDYLLSNLSNSTKTQYPMFLIGLGSGYIGEGGSQVSFW